MNPQSATLPTPAVGPTSPPPAPEPPINSGPSIVTNIPVHTQQTPPAAQPAEDTDLDKIMHEVNHELKKPEQKPQKHGFLLFGHGKPKPLVRVNNQPKQPQAATQAEMAQTPPVAAVSILADLPAVALSSPQAKPQPSAMAKTAAKPKTSHNIPVFVIFVALCVTGFLIAAAIATYRQT